MRSKAYGIVVLIVLSVPNSSRAQSGAKKKPPRVIALSGCVQRDANARQQFVITDAREGTYRLSGKDFREYLGKAVTVNGGVAVKGFVVKGGLTPNPNIAAQAGALDPSRAAVQAATADSNTGVDTGLPEFRVKKIEAGGGSCEPS